MQREDLINYSKYVEVAPYWNVNRGTKIKNHLQSEVEVAPYWNVNIFFIHIYYHIIFVEVAPYWNVNNSMLIYSNVSISVEVAPYWNVNIQLEQLT